MKNTILFIGFIVLLFIAAFGNTPASHAAVMSDYCIQPPFVAQSVPPLVMFEMGRDHKFYFQAYNDATDLDGDGKIDTTYNHTINYYGYFDPFKCYTHTGGSGNTDQFTPVSVSSNKFCSSGQWSGNVLNWITMSRMDALRKVLYGGKREPNDSNVKTILERAYVPQDAHSWGKELTGRLCYNGTATYTTPCSQNSDCDSGWSCVDKSNQIIGINAADAPSACASSVTPPVWNTAGRIFVAKYSHPNHNGTCGDYSLTSTAPPVDCPECPPTIVINDSILSSYEPSSANLLGYYYIPNFGYVDSATNKDVQPDKDHGNNINFLMVTEFNVTNSAKGDWNFLIDSDDGAYLMIDGQIVSNYPGCHANCYNSSAGRTPNAPATASVCSGTLMGPTVKTCSTNLDCSASEGTCQTATPVCNNITQPMPQGGTVSLTAGYHRMIVRQSENAGQDGVRVWYKAKGDNSWTLFGTATGSSALTLRAPTIGSGNDCSITTMPFIESGAPSTGVAKRHLFCNTTLSDGGTPIMRYITNRTEKIWQWSTMESTVGPSCGSKIYNNAANDNFSATSAITPTDLSVRVEVCKSGIPGAVINEDYEFERCKDYTGTKKPIGLLQKYGEAVDGVKVCSQGMSKVCSNDADCNLATEGLCVYKSGMYFGLFSSTYDKNKSGGMLRKNIGSILDEVNINDGSLKDSNNIPSGIIYSIDKFKIADFKYSNYKYSNCQFNDHIMNEGDCRDWGNPISEMMYESLRYIAGKNGPLDEFKVGGTTDGGITFKKPEWGEFKQGDPGHKPYDVYPYCAKPFILLLSDINTSFDDDQVPGNAFTAYGEDGALPLLNMDVKTLANTIGTTEGINNNNWFIGQNATAAGNFLCDSKNASGNLSLLRGICPEEPTKKGSFYSAAVAFYGKTQFKNIINTSTGKKLPPVNTFSVALSSPMADLKFKLKDSSNNDVTVTFVPVGKSVSGSSAAATCSARCPLPIDNSATGKGLSIGTCSSGAYCPTNAIVNVFFEDARYSGDNLIYARFRINYENYEQGNDFDQDALVSYELCTRDSVGQPYSFCSTALGSDQIEIKVDSRAASGSTDQALGFVINGTTADGSYLVVKDRDVGGTSPITTLPLSWQRVLTVSSSATTAGILKNPLWYAAKWGGFEDGNGSGTPDLRNEWAKKCTETDESKCNPDNYYLVNNPLELERQLDRALTDILAKVSSGTAASIVNNSGESGTNILQALYFPQKEFSGTQVSWVGELQNMWFYLDPRITNSAIREDTINDRILDLNADLIAEITFDDAQGKTVVNRKNNNGVGVGQIELDDLQSLWKAGQLLQNRNMTSDPRLIKTSTDGSSLIDFSLTNSSTLQPYLQAATPVESSRIINYVIGNDTPTDATLRNRTVTYKGSTGPWRLGDIISSTPKIQGSAPMQGYDLDYNDLTYKDFFGTVEYKKHNMVYAGSNDGMLHAFTLGMTSRLRNATQPTKVAQILPNNDTLGREEWAYIPKNALPYLRYLSQPDYSHLYTVDGKIRLIDVSINVPTSSLNSDPPDARCDAAHYWNCYRTTMVINSGTRVCSNEYTRGCANDAGCESPGTCTVPYTYIDPAETSWRSVLIAGMGLGGASRSSDGTCLSSTPSSPSALPDCVKTPIITPTGYENVGLSSYVAMDVSNPLNPSLMWEFSAPGLGYTLSQPAIVRINGKKGGGGTTVNDADTSKNGRWFAIFASGPTGPINTATHQFYGKSDQNLKLFIVDLKTGVLERTIDTAITNAFAGQFGSASAVDTDAWNPHDQGYKDPNNSSIVLDQKGYYSTDAVYLGYTNYDAVNKICSNDTTINCNNNADCGTGNCNPKWNGGVVRLMTMDDTDPAKWQMSKVIENIGPVTTAVTMLQDRREKKLWLYFGTGRYFYKDATGMDDPDDRRYLYGITEPCYPRGSDITAINDLDVACTTQFNPANLVDKSDEASATANKGWKIKLWSSWTQFKAERLLTNPTALYTGNVSFTTFQPTADVCGYGGQTFVWVVDGMSGGTAAASSLSGLQLLIQLTTGAFAKINPETDLVARLSRRTGTDGVGEQSSSDNKAGVHSGGTGSEENKILKPPKGVPRILHYKER